MSRAGRWLLFSAGVLLFIALSTGSPLFLYAAALLGILWALGGIAAGVAAHTLRLELAVSPSRVRRGEEALLEVRVRHRGLLPIAPLRLQLTTTQESEALTQSGETLRLPFRPAHVGPVRPGIRQAEVEDLFGLWHKRVIPPEAGGEVLALPLLFETEPLSFAPGDPGAETMARATEDISSPSDLRAYQPGDPMKKIHWKLSARKGELLLRKYDEPILQDALVLMDCSAPPTWGRPEAAADVRDTLVETAASLMAQAQGGEHPITLPLQGAHPMELKGSMPLDVICEHLARLDFSADERFEQVLLWETRRLRSVGSVVILSARLNGAMVELMCRMRQLGPMVRLYLVTFSPEDPRLAPMIARLQQAEVEVAYVRPGVWREKEARA